MSSWPSDLRLGDKIITPPLCLAPMMNLTGRAFRRLVRHYGGCGLFYSEMFNSRRVPNEKDDAPMFAGLADEQDIMLQLVGNDPNVLEAAVHRLEVFPALGYDLNMGCSRAAIMKHGWGAGLLRTPATAFAAVKAMRRATDKLLTAKIRLAWEDDKTAREFVSALADEGLDAMIVHPRTAEKRFARPPHWEWVAKIQSWLKIPVIGNGDIASVEEALLRVSQTGCQGLMIGRAAVGKPFIFRDIAAALNQQPLSPPDPPQVVFEKLLLEFENELEQAKRFSELKTFCEFFAERLPVPHWFWGPLQSEREAMPLIRKVRQYFSKSSHPAAS